MESNRYSPPAAAVADVGGSTFQPVRLWPPSGRLGRLRFLAYGVGLYIVFGVAAFAFGVVGALFAHDSSFILVIGYLGIAVYLAASVVLIVQRSHDMNLSGWWSFAAMIPLVGLVWIFKGGTPGINRFGAPPPPNGIGVRIVALAFPVLALIGIVAAVALPAYQQYTLRAHASGTR